MAKKNAGGGKIPQIPKGKVFEWLAHKDGENFRALIAGCNSMLNQKFFVRTDNPNVGPPITQECDVQISNTNRVVTVPLLAPANPFGACVFKMIPTMLVNADYDFQTTDFPAGTYTVSYVTGAFIFNTFSGKWSVTHWDFPVAGNGIFVYHPLDTDGKIVTDFDIAPGGQFFNQEDAQTYFTGMKMTFTTTVAGKIGLRFFDIILDDNEDGDPNPTFKICPGLLA